MSYAKHIKNRFQTKNNCLIVLLSNCLIISVLAITSCVCDNVKADNIETQTRTARLIFIGDVMSHEPQVAGAAADFRDRANRADTTDTANTANTADTADTANSLKTAEGYDYGEVFRAFEPIFEGADVVVANLETTLRTTPPYTGYPAFAAPAELAFDMQRAGIDIVTTANNHTCDRGARGIRSTIAILDSAGLRHTGSFADSADRAARNPLYFNANGLRFALLTYTYGTNGVPVPRGTMVNLIDTTLIARDMATIDKTITDCVIVSYHWGEEYRNQPNRVQKSLAEWTRNKGADIVIGGHPHVVEPMEAYRDSIDTLRVTGATYYSLGNFVSNQRRRYTNGGMTAEITVSRTDSLPLKYSLGYRLFWVYTPVIEGVMRYRAVPSAALDTLLTAEKTPAARTQFDLFMRDSRELLAPVDSVFFVFK